MMTRERELLQQALDALDRAISDDRAYIRECKDAAEAIRAHLAAQPAPAEDFCYCDDDISLQMVSGGAALEGLYGRVTLKIGDAYVNYVKAQPAPAEHVAWCKYEQRHERPTRIVLCDSDEDGAFRVYAAPPAAQPAPAEPVALESVHLTRDINGMCTVRVNGRVAIQDNGDIIDHMATLEWFAAPPAAPAPAAPVVPLTDEQINEMWRKIRAEDDSWMPLPHEVFARAIERAHGITGGGNG